MNNKSTLFLALLATTLTGSVMAQKKPLSWQDIPSWQFIRTNTTQTSNDAKWIAYVAGPTQGDLTLTLCNTVDTTKFDFKIGGLNSPFAFNDNAQFLAFYEAPNYKEVKANEKAKKPISRKLKLISLKDTSSTVFDKATNFEFANQNNNWIAIRFENNSIKTDASAKGNDLILYNYHTKKTHNIGNVAEYKFNKTGQYIAYTIDAFNKNGNGIFLLDLHTGLTNILENDNANFSKISWNKEGTAFTLLKSKKEEKYKTPVYTILAVKNIKGQQAELISYTGLSDNQITPGYGISNNTTPYWSKDLSTVFFGINKLEKSEEAKKSENKSSSVKDSVDSKNTDNKALAKNNTAPAKPTTNSNKKDIEKPDMIIWNWQDKKLQSAQKNQSQNEKNRVIIAAWSPKNNKFTALTDSTIKSISLAPNEKIAYGLDLTPYEYNANLDGQNYADLYIIDVATATKRLAIEKLYLNASRNLLFSPNSQFLLYYEDGHYYTLNLATLAKTNISKNIPSSFVDIYDDHNISKVATQNFGWTLDNKYILLKDNFDLWKVSYDGKNFIKLTDNWKNKKLTATVYNKIYEDDEAIDLKKDQYFNIINSSNKQKGIALLAANKNKIEILKVDDINLSSLKKAKNADKFFYTIENSKTAPEIFISDKTLKEEKQLTSNTPDTAKYSISAGSKLISYISDHGDTLQATLYLPANYVEGQSYPTITYIYERLTDEKNVFSNPAYPGGGFNRAMYTSNGYAVLMPDIKYKLNDPGMSAVACVVPAVKAAINTGIVDGNNVAIHGHSWGGYQTAFLITQTNIFKAAVAGAPLTNMISMYSLIYWNSGSSNQSIFESSQGRLTSGYWDNWDAYTRNSPIYHIKKVNTPLIIMHNDKDGAVDYTQGIEYYNGLRRLNKPVVMLTYNGENHGLVKEANRKDYAVRMMEYFDHYLKGAPSPTWWSKGIAYNEMEKHLEERAF